MEHRLFQDKRRLYRCGRRGELNNGSGIGDMIEPPFTFSMASISSANACMNSRISACSFDRKAQEPPLVPEFDGLGFVFFTLPAVRSFPLAGLNGLSIQTQGGASLALGYCLSGLQPFDSLQFLIFTSAFIFVNPCSTWLKFNTTTSRSSRPPPASPPGGGRPSTCS